MAIELYDLAGADAAHRFSPYCWRVRMALAHKGLDAQTIPVRFGEKHKIEFSGQKLVPVIRDGEHVISDSWQIAHYLDRTYPSQPMLMDGKTAALTNFVRSWVQTRLGLPIMRMVLMDIHDACAREDQSYFRSSREARLGKSLEDFVVPEAEGRAVLKCELAPLRDLFAQQPFVCGEEAAYADYIVFGHFMWARGISRKTMLDADDPVHAWRERMLDLFSGLARNVPGLGA